MPKMKKRAIGKKASTRPNKRTKQVAGSSSNTPQTPTLTRTGNELFARLPFEIRVMIWKLLLTTEDPIEPEQIGPRSNVFFIEPNPDYEFFKSIEVCDATREVTSTLTRVLMTCRLFYQDQQARLTFYELNKFSFVDSTSFVQYFAAITPSRRRALAHVQISSVTLHHPITNEDFRLGQMGSPELALTLQECVGMRKLVLEFDQPQDRAWLTHQLRTVVSWMPLLKQLDIREAIFMNDDFYSRRVVISKTKMDNVTDYNHVPDDATLPREVGLGHRYLLVGAEEDVLRRVADIWHQLRGDNNNPLPLKSSPNDKKRRATIYKNIQVDMLGEHRDQREARSLGPASHTRSRTQRQVNGIGQIASKVVPPDPEQVQDMWQPFREIRMSERHIPQLLLIGRGLRTPDYPRQSHRITAGVMALGEEETWKDLSLIFHQAAPEDVMLSFAYDLVGFYRNLLSRHDKADGTPHPNELLWVIEYHVIIEGDESPAMRGVMSRFETIADVWDVPFNETPEA